jgi:hypothetical protein
MRPYLAVGEQQNEHGRDPSRRRQIERVDDAEARQPLPQEK